MTVQFVTMSRSGHHLLVRLIKQARPEITYCEYYRPEGCCRSIPCTKGVDFQKSHDFGLNEPIDPARRYIIQIRDPMESIASHYEIDVAERSWKKRGPDIAMVWRRFARKQIKHRIGFYAKWAQTPPPLALVIRYLDLVSDPLGTVDLISRFVWGEPARHFAAEPIKATRRVEDFRHYDMAFFADLSALAAKSCQSWNRLK